MTVSGNSTGEYSEKHSRFIATLYPCDSEARAQELIAAHKSKYWDARHNVYAYILKDNTAKFSDDGEPHSTAGKPVYDCISHSGLYDVIMIVTRYFGGILLGTGGLVRAYSSAAKAAIDAAERVTMTECAIFSLSVPYSDQRAVAAMLGEQGVSIIETDFSESVKITFAVRTDGIDDVITELREISAGRLEATELSRKVLPIIIKK